MYVKPTFVWNGWGDSYFFVSPKVWKYLNISYLNYDIKDYWGYVDLELTWRSNFGLHVETYTWFANEVNTFNVQLTYPLNKLWSPLNFYLFVDYWNGAGETILRYDFKGTGFLVGIAFSR